MNNIFLLSIVLKGIGAILEIVVQILITRMIGVDGFGRYSTVINTADVIFFIFFSGIVKCNTFYLSEKQTSLTGFKKKYFVRYVLPVIVIINFILFKAHIDMGIWITGICVAELIVMDMSSSMMAGGEYVPALFGEYVLGRAVLLTAVFVFKGLTSVSAGYLVVLYLTQFLIIELFFLNSRRRSNSIVSNASGSRKGNQRKDISEQVSLKKWGVYQWSDILQSMISQMPVILQFLLGGAFEAGVVTIVLLVKKLINFISGPTAKVFLPEFSRLFREGKKEEIKKRFAEIMRIQMVFVAPMTVALVGFPGIILRLFANELILYKNTFRMCAIVFLIAASLGPNSGLLQMTGNERRDIRCREIAIVCMAAAMAALYNNSLFVLYGLCVHMAIEESLKFLSVCRWMGDIPVRLFTYLKWWICPIAIVSIINVIGLDNSFVLMMIMCGLTFILYMYMEKEQMLQMLHKRNHPDG